MALSQATTTSSGATPTTSSFLGPLPTSFSAPTTCGTMASLRTIDVGTTIWEIASQIPTCLPSNWIVNGYYSPGLCPYGYTNACSMTTSDVETTICCPTNYNFACYSTLAYGKYVCSSSIPTAIVTLPVAAPIPRDRYERFFSHTNFLGPPNARTSNRIEVSNGEEVSSGITVSFELTLPSSDEPVSSQPSETNSPMAPINSTGNGNTDTSTWSILSSLSPQTSASRTIEIEGPDLWAYSIQIQKAASKLSAPSSSPSDIPMINSPATTISSQGGPGSPSTPSLPNGALSTPAIAGIAVGVLGALLLGATGSYLFMRRRKTRNVPFPSLADKPAHRSSSNSLHELDEQRNPSEMSAWDERYSRGPNRPMAWELPAQHNASEMPAWDEHHPQGPNKPMAWELPA